MAEPRLGLTPVDPGTLVRAARSAGASAGDPVSYARWMALLAGLGGARSRSRPDAVTTLALRPLDGRRVTVRLQGSDAKVLLDAFVDRWHVPPPGAVAEPRVVVDLGAAIGVTMAHYATLYPGARIVGVELDAATARLAEANVAPWADRCTVVAGAIWPTDGTIAYGGEASEQCGFRVGPGEGSVVGRARALSIGTLLDEQGIVVPGRLSQDGHRGRRGAGADRGDGLGAAGAHDLRRGARALLGRRLRGRPRAARVRCGAEPAHLRRVRHACRGTRTEAGTRCGSVSSVASLRHSAAEVASGRSSARAPPCGGAATRCIEIAAAPADATIDVLHGFGAELQLFELLPHWRRNRCPLIVSPVAVVTTRQAQLLAVGARVKGAMTSARMRAAVLGQADAIVALTANERDVLVRALGAKTERVIVIGNGVDPAADELEPVPDAVGKEPFVLMVGAVSERKRQREVLEALHGGRPDRRRRRLRRQRRRATGVGRARRAHRRPSGSTMSTTRRRCARSRPRRAAWSCSAAPRARALRCSRRSASGRRSRSAI